MWPVGVAVVKTDKAPDQPLSWQEQALRELQSYKPEFVKEAETKTLSTETSKFKMKKPYER